MRIKIAVMALLSLFVFTFVRPQGVMAIEPVSQAQTHAEIDSEQDKFKQEHEDVRQYLPAASVVAVAIILIFLILHLRRT